MLLPIVGCALLGGCSDARDAGRPTDLVAHWCHDISSPPGVRCTVMRDGTTIVTIGHADDSARAIVLRRAPGSSAWVRDLTVPPWVVAGDLATSATPAAGGR